MQILLSIMASLVALALPSTDVERDPFEARLAEILADASDPATCSAKAARSRIGELGSGAVPAVLERLRTAGSGETAVLLDAMPLLGRASVSEAVRARLDQGGVPSDWRIGALRALGSVGRESDVELTVETSYHIDGTGSGLTPALEDATRLILARDPHAVRTAVHFASTVDVERAVALVRAHGAAPPSMTLGPLGDLLDQRAEISLAVLAEIGRAGLRGSTAPPAAVSERVRALLATDDVAILREATLAAGRLGDFEAAERLIELLDHEGGGVSASAHQALRDLTGLGLGPDPERWRGWLTTEAGWFRDHGRNHLGRLANEVRIDELRESLRDVALHRYERHTIAEAITGLLEHQDHTVRTAACATLSQLGSPRGIPSLAALLDDRAEMVAEGAWSALRALTGEDLPREREAWDAFLATR